jgi:hypothetical protein
MGKVAHGRIVGISDKWKLSEFNPRSVNVRFITFGVVTLETRATIPPCNQSVFLRYF